MGGEQIPIQTRLMTIADIFDARTASDRPYKRAMPVPKALDIMTHEVKGGDAGPGIVPAFTEARVFEQRDEG
ncbi:MAG: HD domain-containing phosphohydrolase [Gemmatimonadales bacterium]